MKNLFLFLFIAFVLLYIVNSFKEKPVINNNSTEQEQAAATVDAIYHSKWKTPTDKEIVEIGITLAGNHVSFCGEYYIKKSFNSDSEYLVACTSDGKGWNYYQVWPHINEVIHVSDPGITKPY